VRDAITSTLDAITLAELSARRIAPPRDCV